MEIKDYLEQKKDLYSLIMEYIDPNSDDGEFLLENIYKKTTISMQKEEFRIFLKLISKISNNHHRSPDFIDKIKKIFLKFSSHITKTFTDPEIFLMFKGNKLFLLILFELKIIKPDNYLRQFIDGDYDIEEGDDDDEKDQNGILNENYIENFDDNDDDEKDQNEILNENYIENFDDDDDEKDQNGILNENYIENFDDDDDEKDQNEILNENYIENFDDDDDEKDQNGILNENYIENFDDNDDDNLDNESGDESDDLNSKSGDDDDYKKYDDYIDSFSDSDDEKDGLENGKNQNLSYWIYFFPEIKSYLSQEDKKLLEQKISEYGSEKYEEKRKKGENDYYICELIREDSVKQFIAHVNQASIPLNNTIKQSIFETNSFLIRNKTISLIEYSAFYGSIQIFNFLKLSNVELSPSLWLYAIHSNNADLIHILEESHVQPPLGTFATCLKEAIKCHHNDIARYIIDILIKEDKIYDVKHNFSDNVHSYSFKYFNYFDYYFKPDELEPQFSFYYVCWFGYFTLVKLYLKTCRININKNIFKI